MSLGPTCQFLWSLLVVCCICLTLISVLFVVVGHAHLFCNLNGTRGVGVSGRENTFCHLRGIEYTATNAPGPIALCTVHFKDAAATPAPVPAPAHYVVSLMSPKFSCLPVQTLFLHVLPCLIAHPSPPPDAKCTAPPSCVMTRQMSFLHIVRYSYFLVPSTLRSIIDSAMKPMCLKVEVSKRYESVLMAPWLNPNVMMASTERQVNIAADILQGQKCPTDHYSPQRCSGGGSV